MNCHSTPYGKSPSWKPATKIVVGVAILVSLAALLVEFRDFIGPLLLAFMLAYLLQPPARWLTENTPLPWRVAVSFLYLLLVLLILALLALAGIGLLQQAENLYGLVQDFLLNTLPSWIQNLSTHAYSFGPWQVDFQKYDLAALSQQILSTAQPLVGSLGSIISTLAASTLSLLGWMAFIVLTSYFLLAESERITLAEGKTTSTLFSVDILPEYRHDFRCLGQELGRIWNAFIRGQLTIALIEVVVVWLWLTIFGVRSALVLAIIAGIARFVPYVGPATLYTIVAIVSLFQGSNPWGFTPLKMALIAVGVLFVWDNTMDSLITPQVLGDALGVHPAAVLLTALIGAKLFGVLGLLFAAPTVASLRLFGHYITRKMLDQDPWEDWNPAPPTKWLLGVQWLKSAWSAARSLFSRKEQ